MTDNEKLEEARRTAEATSKALKKRGWCFWKCHKELNGDIITVMRDGFEPTEDEEKEIMRQLGIIYDEEPDKAKINKEWLGTVYYEKELKILAESSNMHFLHEAKKISGGTLLPEGEL